MPRRQIRHHLRRNTVRPRPRQPRQIRQHRPGRKIPHPIPTGQTRRHLRKLRNHRPHLRTRRHHQPGTPRSRPRDVTAKLHHIAKPLVRHQQQRPADLPPPPAPPPPQHLRRHRRRHPRQTKPPAIPLPPPRVVANRQQHLAPPKPRRRILRRQRNRPPIAVQGRIDLQRIEMRQSQIVQRHRIVSHQPQRRPPRQNCRPRLQQPPMHLDAIPMHQSQRARRHPLTHPQLGRPIHQPRRPRQVPLPHRRHARQMQRLRILLLSAAHTEYPNRAIAGARIGITGASCSR